MFVVLVKLCLADIHIDPDFRQATRLASGHAHLPVTVKPEHPTWSSSVESGKGHRISVRARLHLFSRKLALACGDRAVQSSASGDECR